MSSSSTKHHKRDMTGADGEEAPTTLPNLEASPDDSPDFHLFSSPSGLRWVVGVVIAMLFYFGSLNWSEYILSLFQ